MPGHDLAERLGQMPPAPSGLHPFGEAVHEQFVHAPQIVGGLGTDDNELILLIKIA